MPAIVQRVAGGGTQEQANGGKALETILRRPTGLAVDADGTLWIVDSNSGTLLSVADGKIHVLVTDMTGPFGDAVTAATKVYVAERGTDRLLMKQPGKALKVIAGQNFRAGFGGDNGPARNALLSQPSDVAVDDAGNVYIADTTNQRIRRIDADSGKITTIAGNGTPGFSGDGGPAKKAQLYDPQQLVVDPAGTELFIGDYYNGRVRRVDLKTGDITTIAGSGIGSVSYDPLLTATQTPIARISALARDPLGRVYTTIFYGNKGNMVMRINRDGTLTRILGGGTSTAEGLQPDQFATGDILAMDFDPVSGDLLFAQSDGRVLRLAGVANLP